MKSRLLFSRFLFFVLILLIAAPETGLYAQKSRSNPITGQGIFHRKVKQKKNKTATTTPKGKAGKAVRAQAKKAKALDRKNADADKKLKNHHFDIQSKSTQERMINNRKKTDESYKAKRQKIKKESRKPRNHKAP